MSSLRVLTIDRATFAELVGLSESTIRQMEAAELIPARLAFRGRARWSLDEVEAWVSAGCPVLSEWRALWGRYRRKTAQPAALALRIPGNCRTAAAEPSDPASAEGAGS